MWTIIMELWFRSFSFLQMCDLQVPAVVLPGFLAALDFFLATERIKGINGPTANYECPKTGPRASIYGIFTYICHKNQPNV